jgi:hypothetical protein
MGIRIKGRCLEVKGEGKGFEAEIILSPGELAR